MCTLLEWLDKQMMKAIEIIVGVDIFNYVEY